MEICRSCHAPVRWVVMAKTGRRNPLNEEPDGQHGNVVIDDDGRGHTLKVDDVERARAAGEELYLSHFATCPQRKDWRKR